jgi:hypothetical protein
LVRLQPALRTWLVRIPGPRVLHIGFAAGPQDNFPFAQAPWERRGGGPMSRDEVIIKDTHRGLYYEDGVLT